MEIIKLTWHLSWSFSFQCPLFIPLKTSENQRFSGVFRGDQKGIFGREGLRQAIPKRSPLKNKANNRCKAADKSAYKKQRNLVVKLNKGATTLS